MKCPEKRVCIEEMAPTVCLHHKCRRHLRSRCVPSPQLSPPSECHQVSCPNGTVCHVLHTKGGRHAHCVKNKPSSCVELGPCEPGMVCKVRRGREHSIAHCVAKHSSINPKPQDCSQVKCQKGFECAIFGGKHVRPRCVHQKPLPKTCMDLDCQAINMSCHETVKGPECFVASQCKELACGKDQYCLLKTYHGRNLTLAECAQRSHRNCDTPSSESCIGNHVCLAISQEGQYPGTSQCLQTGCSNSSCASPTQTCIILPEQASHIVGVSSLCLPSAYALSLQLNTNCSSSGLAVCPTRGVRGTFSSCQELSVDGVTIGTVCSSLTNPPAISCEELVCDSDKECVQMSRPGLSGDITRADCVSSMLINKMFE